MRIEIDTSKDSTDDIKKMIDFLLKFVSEGGSSGNVPTVGDGTFNLFDNPSTSKYDNDDDKEETPSVSIVEY